MKRQKNVRVRASSRQRRERTNGRKGVASKWLLSMSRARSLPSRAAELPLVVIIFVSVPRHECARPRSEQVSCESQFGGERERGEPDRAASLTRL